MEKLNKWNKWKRFQKIHGPLESSQDLQASQAPSVHGSIPWPPIRRTMPRLCQLSMEVTYRNQMKWIQDGAPVGVQLVNQTITIVYDTHNCIEMAL